jgi:hypothetical protein
MISFAAFSEISASWQSRRQVPVYSGYGDGKRVLKGDAFFY